MFTFAGTGHRPPKIGGYQIIGRLAEFAAFTLSNLHAEKVISGMALGWDQALAIAAVDLGIPFIAAVPFHGQDSKWPAASQNKYRWLLSKASEVVYVSDGTYSPAKMQIRNQYMVDHADYVLALWDGSRGGTYNCIQYATSKGVMVCNVYKPWVDYRAEN